MISTNWETVAENDFADECIRVIPSIAAARIRNDGRGVHALYKTLWDSAAERGLPETRVWQIFGTSAMYWMTSFVLLKARAERVPPDLAATDLIAHALARSASGV